MAKYTYSLKKQIGKNAHTFLIEGENFYDVVHTSKNLSFDDVQECGLCHSKDLELGAHETKSDGYKYVHIDCKACKGRLNFGQQKKNTEIYYLRTREEGGKNVLDWQKYTPSNVISE